MPEKKPILGQGVFITDIDNNPTNAKYSIEMISASVFPYKNGTVDTWLQILISNLSDKELSIKSITLNYDVPVSNLKSASYLFGEGAGIPTIIPAWSNMYQDFIDYSRTDYTFKFELDNYRGTTKYQLNSHYNCTPDLVGTDGKCITVRNFRPLHDKNSSDVNQIILPSYLKERDERLPSCLVFLKWTDGLIVDKIDECTYYFDYLVASKKYGIKRVYFFIVLPDKSLYLSSNSKPNAKMFRPIDERLMFNEWSKKYNILSTNERRILRCDNLKEKSKKSLYANFIYSFPSERFRNQIFVFGLALVSGSILGAILGDPLSKLLSYIKPDWLMIFEIIILSFVFVISVLLGLKYINKKY